MIKNDELIDVLSYESSPIGIKTKDRDYIFEPASEESPFIIPLTLPEIRYANSTCNHFQNGFLFFNDEVKEEVYKELRILNWENIKRTFEIEDMLLHPTLDKLQWIVDVQDNQLFERIRGIMVGLENAGADITVKVKNIINQRFEEFRTGKTKHTEIVLRPKDIAVKQDPKVEALEAQIADMKAMMEQMIAQQNEANVSVNNESTEKEDAAKPVAAKPGRPPKKKV